jgi:hypothetical protein
MSMWEILKISGKKTLPYERRTTVYGRVIEGPFLSYISVYSYFHYEPSIQYPIHYASKNDGHEGKNVWSIH